MPLTVHHLQVSQSERIPWLCEELGIAYTLELHQRAPFFAPPSIYALNPLGQAPVIQDGSLTLAESAACVDYIIHKHGNGRLALAPTHKNYPDYLYWFHLANGGLQPQALVTMQMSRMGKDDAVTQRYRERLETTLGLYDERLAGNAYLAGEEFTAADIMSFFSFTTMRTFFPVDLSRFGHLLAYMKRVSEREGYRRARERADPGLELMIEGPAPKSFADKLKEKSG